MAIDRLRRPVISVVVPTFNRPDGLRRCLEALCVQDFDRSAYEVVVVDDGGSADVRSLLPRALEPRFVFVRQDNGGPARARNRGAEVAAGDLVAFTDDDCAADPGWLSALHRAWSADPRAAVGGRVLNGLPENLCSSASQCLVDYIYAYYNADRDDARFFCSSNIALPRQAFHAIGGFDPSFSLAAGEDRDLCERWRFRGKRIRYAEDACVHHYHRLDVRAFCRQHFNYGIGAHGFHTQRRSRANYRHTLEPVAFYAALLAFPFRHHPPARAAAISALFAASQGMMALGFAASVRQATGWPLVRRRREAIGEGQRPRT